MTGYDWGDDFLEMWVRPVLIGVIDRFIICLLFTAYISKCTCSIYLYDIISCIDINLYRIYIYVYTVNSTMFCRMGVGNNVLTWDRQVTTRPWWLSTELLHGRQLWISSCPWRLGHWSGYLNGKFEGSPSTLRTASHPYYSHTTPMFESFEVWEWYAKLMGSRSHYRKGLWRNPGPHSVFGRPKHRDVTNGLTQAEHYLLQHSH